jgi:S-adenosylmethionine hydrolase
MYTLIFLTDYGWQDAYVGTLKAAALSTLTPQAKKNTTLLDLSHAVPAFQIHIGAWQLLTSLPYCPPDSIFVCVVDPDVGDATQNVLITYRASFNQWFIAPDNGLLAPLLTSDATIQVWRFTHQSLQNAFGWQYASSSVADSVGATFAGRDLYAPLAAVLLNKLTASINVLAWLTAVATQHNAIAQAWQPCTNWQQPIQHSTHQLQGNTLLTDTFGNIITTIPHYWLPTNCLEATLHYPPHQVITLPIVPHYRALKTELLGIVKASHGYIELARYQQSAQQQLNVSTGTEITLTLLEN